MTLGYKFLFKRLFFIENKINIRLCRGLIPEISTLTAINGVILIGNKYGNIQKICFEKNNIFSMNISINDDKYLVR